MDKIKEKIKEFDEIYLEKRGLIDWSTPDNGLKSFFSQALTDIYKEGLGSGRKESIGAIDLKVSKNFNQELKKENSEILEMAKEDAFKKGQVDGAEKLRKVLGLDFETQICNREENKNAKYLTDEETSIYLQLQKEAQEYIKKLRKGENGWSKYI